MTTMPTSSWRPDPVAFTAASSSSSTKLERAYLEIRNPPASGSPSAPGSRLGDITFAFNPKSLKVSKSANWKRENQRNQPSSGVPEFTGAGPSSLSVDMFFDATDSHDDRVVKAVELLLACCVPTKDSRGTQKPSPPWVIFHWGSLTGFVAYVKQVQVTYSLFSPGGTPIRAEAQVSMEEISGDIPRQNPTSGSLAATGTHRVTQGDTLAGLAWSEYGDPNRWRAIADANRIEDPLRLRPGATLLLPKLDQGSRPGQGGPT